MNEETQTFNISADPELVDTTYIDQLVLNGIQARRTEQRAEMVQTTSEHLGRLVGVSGAVWERTTYMAINSERAVRWIGKQIWLDMTNQK